MNGDTALRNKNVLPRYVVLIPPSFSSFPLYRIDSIAYKQSLYHLHRKPVTVPLAQKTGHRTTCTENQSLYHLHRKPVTVPLAQKTSHYTTCTENQSLYHLHRKPVLYHLHSKPVTSLPVGFITSELWYRPIDNEKWIRLKRRNVPAWVLRNLVRVTLSKQLNLLNSLP